MTDEQILAELEVLLRSKPENLTRGTDDSVEWLGRALSLIDASGSFQSTIAVDHVQTMHNPTINGNMRMAALSNLLVCLNQVRSSLRLKTLGPVSTAIGQGMVFEYFDEVRKLIESATKDILFVDPYLEAEFVSRYLPFIPNGVNIRLLTTRYLDKLVPAVKAYSTQKGNVVMVRSTPTLHDRHFFIDGSNGYQSGASFKDGALKAPTGIIQVTDTFTAVKKIYEDMWDAAKIEL